MKIAIDCRMIGSGGIGSYISALLPYFIENNECLLIGTKEQISPFSANTESIVCDEKCFSIKETLCFSKEIIKKINSCDVHYSPYCNIPENFFHKIKVPIFTTIHDVVFLDVPGLASKSGTFIRKLFYRRAMKKSKGVFTVSEFSASRIKYHLKSKTPVICTYNALPGWFSNAAGEKTEKSGILFVGNIKKHKGLSTLLDAYQKARDKGLNEKLIIVGNKDNFRTGDQETVKKIEECKDGQITFTGKIGSDELSKTYSGAKVLVQPSLYEGFGMPPLEAMNLGTHVILSDIPVFKEIYKDFPVTYFKTEDSDDLAEKLLSIDEISSKPLEVPQIYSFEKTHSIIQKTLEGSL